MSKFFQQEGKAMKLQEKTESNFRSRKAERDTTESSLQEAGLESNSAIDSLVRRVRHRQNRLQVLFLGIKLGIPGSEKALNNALFRYGDEYMALDYLNCGSPELDKGGRHWAYAHGYRVTSSKCGFGTGVECPGGVKWGQF
ncbi:MAG: hypothetical protein IM456_20115 [Microcystis sp. M079S1]|uniref:hypothetical protein n=2 Tax=unclassified Microcystis TaxID=2643300 RepID=UPI00258FA87F|nr:MULTISPECIES: hypothetical protein [unclassified Microcystis]MCA2839681.1 hypothetical protein [Microcystis sp. M078S1]MCA2847031.1 hypothetical protein [Microcystis sp. M074S1]MCA6604158.1 hypothetical protein [Pseudanabaena sp. M007S1SP1A06QC]MCA2669509.1 hypothetical protein [Microcystis sp. M045S2]MCA2844262.1 hypothetical protein [Microcystis sp. M079S1]